MSRRPSQVGALELEEGRAAITSALTDMQQMLSELRKQVPAAGTTLCARLVAPSLRPPGGALSSRLLPLSLSSLAVSLTLVLADLLG